MSDNLMPTYSQVIDLRKQVDDLTVKVTMLQDHIRTITRTWCNEIELISRRLLEASDYWGDDEEFDEWIDSINVNLSDFRLENKFKEYEVTETYRVTRSVVVRAADRAEAIAKVEADMIEVDESEFSRGEWDVTEFERDIDADLT